ncbi:helix-turn-helix domain-containing protein [Chloroflexota bacterium]
MLGRQANTLKLLNKLSVTQLAELSKLSKSYISQVKHGKCPPSQKLLNALANHYGLNKPEKDYLIPFLKSREARGVSPNTLNYYKDRLSKFIYQVDYIKATRRDIERYLNTIPQPVWTSHSSCLI